MLDNSAAIHELGIICEDLATVNMTALINNKSSENKAESWGQIAPELGFAQEMMGSIIYIFMSIILIALSFGIINTMLVGFRKKKELGMLMSVGLIKKGLFNGCIETIFISLVAAPLGIILSYVISHFGTHGIDLSAVSEGLEEQ